MPERVTPGTGSLGAAEPLADPKTKKILIVDDDESVLNLLEILVRRDGFQIDSAITGEETMRKFREARPDALILDLMLPGTTSGFEVLSRLREGKEPVPPIVVVTAYADTREIQEIMKDSNVAVVLSKPINQKKLLDTLHGVLGTAPPAFPNTPVNPKSKNT